MKSLKEKIYFIAGTGTDIGKTFFVENIIQSLKKENVKCDAIKPIISGFCEDDANSDTAKIIKSLQMDFNSQSINQVSPWRFKDPLSPNIAAKNEGLEIDFQDVVDFCQDRISIAKSLDEFLFIESAGGIMSPLTDDKTFLDLATELNIPILMVGGNYLGSISHGLCAIEVVKSRKLDLEYFVVNENPNQEASLEKFTTSKIIKDISGLNSVTLDVFLD